MSDARAPILDTAILVDSLRRAVTYAATAGLLKDGSVLDSLRDADAALAAGREPDARALTLALNQVAADIAPMTLTDLNFGRDPLSPDNQRRSRMQQLVLTVFALLILAHVGYFMHSLRLEQAVVQTLEAIQQQRPQQKLVALRKMAQYDKPLGAPSALHDQYHERVAEMIGLNNRLMSAYVAAVQAASTPLFPADLLWRRVSEAWAARSNAQPPPVATDAAAEAALPADHALCEEADGGFRLPEEAVRYPQWMQLVLADSLSDFCFQLKVFSPGGGGALIHQSLSQLSEVPSIQEKVALRADWFLPFFFGLLGATLSMMRALGNIRLPAMTVFSILMRIALGGVAGIAIGWFSVGAGSGPIHASSVISLPFVLAFVVGYGIDALFAVLDRLNRLIGELAGAPRSA